MREKDFMSWISRETNKIFSLPLGNESNTNFRSKIENTFGKIQNAFIRSVERVLRKNMLKTEKCLKTFLGKIGLTESENNCEQISNGWNEN